MNLHKDFKSAKVHMNNVHSDEIDTVMKPINEEDKVHPCSHCDLKFISEANVKLHMENTQPIPPTYSSFRPHKNVIT